MKNILAFLDGSKYSQSVCDHAAWVAVRGNSSLNFLHVLGRREGSSETSDLSGSIGLGARSALLEELAELDGQKARLVNKRGRAILDDATARVKEMGVTQVSATLRNGQFIRTMQEFESAADLLVIGKRGEASNFDMDHLGSNLERVVRATHKPVLVASRAFEPINRMLIAFDGGASAIKAVEQIAASGIFTGLDCMLLTAGTADNAKTSKRMQGAAALLTEAGFNVDVQIRSGQADDVIINAIEGDNMDLLVMGAYGHSRIRNLIIGSTTTEMVRSCKVPVMLFR